MEEKGPSSGEGLLAKGTAFVGTGDGVAFALPLKSLEPRHLERECECHLDLLRCLLVVGVLRVEKRWVPL